MDDGIGYPLSILAVAGYVGNWVEVFHTELALGDLLNHTWSLAVEEQFYVFWPLLLILLLSRKLSPTTILLALGVLIVASTLLRVLLW